MTLRLILLLIVSMLFSACGGGGGGGAAPTPTSPETVFRLFGASQFIPGTINTTTYTGTDTLGGIYTATLSTQTQNQSIFLGVAAIPILRQLQLNNTANGGSANTISTSYYSTSESDRRYLGFVSSTTAIVSGTSTAIPITGKIGDFGIIGTYTDNVGDILTASYRIDDGGNGNGIIVQLSTTRNRFGTIVESTTSSSVIDVNGNELRDSVAIFFPSQNATITLNSN